MFSPEHALHGIHKRVVDGLKQAGATDEQIAVVEKQLGDGTLLKLLLANPGALGALIKLIMGFIKKPATP